MAKTRRGSRKGSSIKRTKAKGGAAARRRAAPKPTKKKGVELRGVRQKVRQHVATLSAVDQPSDKVRDSIERLNRVLDEMDAICGPHMLIEIP